MSPGKGFPGSQTSACMGSPWLRNQWGVAAGPSQETLEEGARDLGEVGVTPEMPSLPRGQQHTEESREEAWVISGSLVCCSRWQMWVNEGGHRLGKLSPDMASEPTHCGLPSLQAGWQVR